ncbi:hypothetical protein BCR34DRAFT_553235 [Clohesyomyces aquaticus]|uniref:Transposase IS30-like HTH domain-containing protein n=1 Tax=Clohesyomyces aquaticus TaxID=1231657 RepID=A0A1Y2A988_9PLEO|nr:hypothetical protein BCR34DRAFT_553235 [Clohesyomyces aquaticus]
MPNIIRRPRSRQPERRRNRACPSGTHLTYEERRRIYRLSQECSQRGIATTLHLPRTTVQSAIYAMSGRSRKQQNRTQTPIIPVSDSALAAASSRGAVHTLSISNKGIPMQMAYQQPGLTHLTTATPLVPLISMSMPDDPNGQRSQPAVAACHLSNNQRSSLSKERSNTRFNTYESTFGPSLPPCPPKLLPMEPRVIYGSS